jgi:hypothetical protein
MLVLTSLFRIGRDIIQVDDGVRAYCFGSVSINKGSSLTMKTKNRGCSNEEA